MKINHLKNTNCFFFQIFRYAGPESITINPHPEKGFLYEIVQKIVPEGNAALVIDGRGSGNRLLFLKFKNIESNYHNYLN